MNNNIEWPFISEDGTVYNNLSQIAEDYKLSYDTLGFMARKYGIKEAIERCQTGNYSDYKKTTKKQNTNKANASLKRVAKQIGISNQELLKLLEEHTLDDILKAFKESKDTRLGINNLLKLAKTKGIRQSKVQKFLAEYGLEKAEAIIKGQPLYSFCDGYGYGNLILERSNKQVLYGETWYSYSELVKHLNCSRSVLREAVEDCIQNSNDQNIERLKKLKIEIQYKGRMLYGLDGVVAGLNTSYKKIYSYYKDYPIEAVVVILATFSEPVFFLGDEYGSLEKMLTVFKGACLDSIVNSILSGKSLIGAMEYITGLQDNSGTNKPILTYNGVGYYTLKETAKAFHCERTTMYRILRDYKHSETELMTQLAEKKNRKNKQEALDLLVGVDELPKDSNELEQTIARNKQKIKLGCKQFGRVSELARFIGRKGASNDIAVRIDKHLRQGESMKRALEQATGVLWLGYGRDNNLIVQYECPVCKRLRVLEIAEHTEFIGHSEDYCKEKAVYKD